MAGLTQEDAGRLLRRSSRTISAWETKGAPYEAAKTALAFYAERAARTEGILDGASSNGTADEDHAWSPNPTLRNIIPARAYQTAIDYCRRLARAGLPTVEIERLERLMIDTRYAKANSRLGRELPEEDWIILVDDVWDAIQETLASQGIRV